MYKSLSYQQKLTALSMRFYQHLEWTPEAGHYYTTSRADLELYRIAKIENGKVYTEYCTSSGSLTVWDEDGFSTKDFGPSRVWVPEVVLTEYTA